MPSAVAYCSRTVKPLSRERVTVKTASGDDPGLSSRTSTSVRVTVGSASLSTIESRASPSARLALTGALRSRDRFSVGSSMRSPVTATVTVWVRVPGGKVKVPATPP
jgi:hypothetical protein